MAFTAEELTALISELYISVFKHLNLPWPKKKAFIYHYQYENNAVRAVYCHLHALFIMYPFYKRFLKMQFSGSLKRHHQLDQTRVFFHETDPAFISVRDDLWFDKRTCTNEREREAAYLSLSPFVCGWPRLPSLSSLAQQYCLHLPGLNLPAWLCITGEPMQKGLGQPVGAMFRHTHTHTRQALARSRGRVARLPGARTSGDLLTGPHLLVHPPRPISPTA